MKALLRNLALLAATFLIFGVLFETGVRLFAPQPEHLYRFSADTYYEPIPNARFVYRREEFAVPIAYNAFGMRDRERTIEKPPGTLRIAVLGDSFAEAKEVPLDSTVCQLLERGLAGAIPGRRVEVLDFGVSGFGTVSSLVRLETLAARFHPDLVLYLFVHNDPDDNIGKDTRLYALEEGRLVVRRVANSGAKRLVRLGNDWGKRYLHSYRFLRTRLELLSAGRGDEPLEAPAGGAGMGNGAEAVGEGEAGPSEEAWNRTRLALERLRDEAAAAGAPLVVAMATTSGPQMTARLDSLCTAAGIPLIDLVTPLARDAGPVYYRFDGHWRSRGHAIAAAELSRRLPAWLAPRGAADPDAASPANATESAAPDAASATRPE